MANPIPNPQIAEEAAAWAVLIDGGSLELAQRKELARWLTASPTHVEELLLAASLLGGMSQAEASDALCIEGLLHGEDPDVLHLFKHRPTKTPNAAPMHALPLHERNRTWKRPVLAASLAGIALVGTVFAVGRIERDQGQAGSSVFAATADQESLLSTGIGEQRSVVLDDGSIVHLNALSAIRVEFEEQARKIELVSGEALFEVAHDEKRPFRVMAGDTIAQAVGTIFNVERTGDNVKVTVVEGRVLVKNDDGATRLASADFDQGPAEVAPVILAAGQSARVAPLTTIPTVTIANLEGITSWRNRELTFDGDTLDMIAEKFNRYNKVQIEVADPMLAQSEFSGVFDADDPDSFIAFLELTGRFNVDRSDATKVILGQADQ